MRRWALLVLCCACASRGEKAEPQQPRELEAVVEGNKKVSTRDLRAAARREIRAYFAHDRRAADAADAAYSMELLLRERGFAHGRVDFTVRDGRLVFVVAEGPLAQLGDVSFRGVEAAEVKDLLRFFVFEGSGALGTGKPVYDRALVDAAAKDVERHYLLHGYLRVRVLAPEVTFNEAKTRADVTVPVEKGRAYVVRQVQITGAEDLPDLGLVDQPYFVRLPAEAAAKVRRAYLDRGHQRVKVEASAEVDDENATVRISIRVEPGPAVRLREVRFEGQERTREGFLRRRIPLRELETVLQGLLDRGIDNLWRTGLFSTVRARSVPVGEEEADLEIFLKELDARNLDFELGYGSYELARGAVRFRDRNLLGIGRRLTAELRGSVRSAGADVRIADPYVLGERALLEFGSSYLLREEPSFDREAISANVTVTRQLKGPYRVRGGYGIRIEEATDIKQPLTLDQQQGFLRTAGLFASLRRDTRNNVLLPTYGNLVELSTAWSSPSLGADNDFLELEVRASQLFRVFTHGVAVVGVRFTTREVLDSSPTLPIQERLFLGGENTVRSFFESELGPSVGGEPQGGLTAIVATVEVRHPIRKQLYGAMFYDVGNVSPNAFSWTGPAGHAVGIGIRYYLPIGPLRLDFGYNPGRRFAADQPWALHLAFGFSF